MDKNDNPEGQSAAPTRARSIAPSVDPAPSVAPASVTMAKSGAGEPLPAAVAAVQSAGKIEPRAHDEAKCEASPQLPWQTGCARAELKADGAQPSTAAKDEKAAPGQVEQKGPIRKFVALDLGWIRSLVAHQRATAKPGDAVPLVAPMRRVAGQRRGRSIALLAASVTIAAGIGALTGAFGASTLSARTTPVPQAPAPAPSTSGVDAQALKSTITQLRTEIATLRSAVEASSKAANAQSAKLAERFDRLERVRSEPPAWINKTVEALERLERRSDANSSKETTGAISAAPAVPPAVVPGWVVRDVQRGVALIQGPRIGLIEVEAGDVVPILGRIQSIQKQDGRWVVTTSKGIITASR